ncbi:MAG: c-type cytochrome biogenesis protein CcsB [Spirochaetales bacterium]|nr:c-type cytochrome biogenesis protein CcsB [Spirochaetales bacterium]
MPYRYFLAIAFFILLFSLFTGKRSGAAQRQKGEAGAGIFLILLWSAAVLQIAAFVLRGIEAERIPLAGVYDFLLLLGIIITFGIVFIRKRGKRLAGFLIIPVLFILGFAVLLPAPSGPLQPVLRSPWLIVHVSAAALSYAGFLVAMVASVLFIALSAKMKKGNLSEDKGMRMQNMDLVAYQFTAGGFILLTAAIVTGAIWAEQAWSRFWGWDPKETWSLITWITYAVYLHLRLQKHTKKLTTAWLSVFAFCIVIFTYAGVNLLLPGLHSYR